jgi:hypothetical protein
MRSNFYLKLSSAESFAGLLRGCLAVELFCLMFFRESKIYDIPTAVCFALGLALMARGRWQEYLWLFLVGCVNRETTVWLTLVFAVYFFRRMSWGVWVAGIALQALIFVVIRVQLMLLFAGTPGVDFMARPLGNWEAFVRVPWLGALHWVLFTLIVWLCVRNWQRKPVFLRTAFAVLMPVSLVMYVILGNAFEVRVFAEVFPVAWVMATS